MLAQTLPPDTGAYLIAGYAVIFGGMILYVLSLIWRRRRLEADLAALEREEE